MKKLLYSLLAVLALVSCSKEAEVVAPPAANKYTLTITADTGGSVSSPGGTYNEGSKITITATPDGMYLFKEWSDGSTVNPREITVTSNLTLKASFIKKTYPLAVTVEGEGTVAEEVIIQGSTTETEYNAGTTVRLTATPNEGWVFAGWSGDVESDELVIEVPIEKGTSVSALFKRASFELNITIEGEGTVKEEVIVQPSQYDYEPVVRLTAIPAEGYSFDKWSNGSTNKTLELTIEGEINLTAIFKNILSVSYSTITGPPDQINLGFTLAGIIPFNQNNIFFVPTEQWDYPTYPLVHFERDSIWKLKKIYTEYWDMELLRSYKILDEENFVVSDTGLEYGYDGNDGMSPDTSIWPGGHVYHFSFKNGELSRRTISDKKLYFHSVDVGNLTSDDSVDLVSIHLNTWPDDYNNEATNIQMWSSKDNTFSNYEKTTNKLPDLQWDYNGGLCLIVDDFNGDSKDDLVKFQYRYIPTPYEPYSIVLLSDINNDGQLEFVSSSERFDQYPLDFGVAWARSDDFDRDGDKDIIAYSESGTKGFFLDVWENDSDGNFTFHQRIASTLDTSDFQVDNMNNTRDFEVYDFDNDGDVDIFLQPDGAIPYPVDFSNYIYVNDNGVFRKYSKPILWDKDTSNDYEKIALRFLKFFIYNDRPAYFGFKSFDEEAGIFIEDGRLEIVEFILNIGEL